MIMSPTIRPPIIHFLLLLGGLVDARLVAEELKAPEASAWQISGDASFSDTLRPEGGGPSIQLGEGARAVLKWKQAGGGDVVFWTLDDGTISMPEKKRHTGPRWGLIDESGNELLLAIAYAPFVQEEGAYVLIEKDNPGVVKYLGRRIPGKWLKWTFAFDPENGAHLLINDKPADNRWNWNESKFPAISGLVLYGDGSGGEKAQDFLVNVAVKTAGPMKVAPMAPPLPPPVVPDKDPQAEGAVPKFLPDLQSSHPRLLFTKADIPRIKAFYQSPEGRSLKDSLDRYVSASKPPGGPDEVKFLKDATDGQRQGLWRLPSIALHYVLTMDPASKQKVVDYLTLLLALPNWESRPELDSGMSSANIMVGAALAFDWLFDELEPEFREKFRQKLWHQARSQYYGGHLNRNNAIGYWQNDPLNNHRWHRNAGLALAVLAACNGDPEQNWMLQKTAEELEYIARWLPEDGSSHEGASYLLFGGNHLALAFDAADRCLGTRLLDVPFFHNVGYFRLLSLRSSMTDSLPFGDESQKGFGAGYGNFLLLAAEKNGEQDVGGMLRTLIQRAPGVMEFAWFSLIWDRPAFGRGGIGGFPTKGYFPDIGVAYLHDGWKENGVSAMFKSSPFGGSQLNEFRRSPGGAFSYVNVAHDDPDANSFVIALGNELIAQTDGYSSRKQSANHNTVLINGRGQMAADRVEGGKFSQPPKGDMSRMALITGWMKSGVITAIEGEAAGSYLAITNKDGGIPRPALDRFRRSFFWVEGNYILVLDDVRAPAPVDITWLLQAKALKGEDFGRLLLQSGESILPAQIASDREMIRTMGTSPADDRGTPYGWQQLRATVKNEKSARMASIFNPWSKNEISVSLTSKGENESLVTVSSPDFTDEWTWSAAQGSTLPSAIQVRRVKGDGVGTVSMDFSKASQPPVNGPPILSR